MNARRLFHILVLFVLGASGCGNRPFRFQVMFPEAPGLKVGSEVRYLGLKVGDVTKILIQQPENGATPQVAVAVTLANKGIQIRRADRFGIGTQGLLGEAYLDITPGPISSPLISEGSAVQGELTALPLKNVSAVVDPYGLTAKLNSLPEDKREDLLKTFNKLVDEAAGKAGQSPHPSGRSKEP